MSARYAIYFAPDRGSPWRHFGARWLGRDEHDSGELAQPDLPDLSLEEIRRITREPRRYGFHATLKAPFRLKPGCDEATLVGRIGMLATRLRPVPLGKMRAAQLGDFVALVPEESSPSVIRLATTCVTDLDDLRAPLLDAERAHRRIDAGDTRGGELLERYGYPHVLERFRLHLTLTGPVEPALAERVMQAVAPDIARLNVLAPLWLDRLCLFVERSPAAPFHRVIDLKLTG